jgi:hypothetical protein
MISKILPILAFVVCNQLSAKEIPSLSEAFLRPESTGVQQPLSLSRPGLAPKSYDGNGRRTNFYWGVDLGYDHGKIKTDSVKTGSGGFTPRLEIGAKIELGNGGSDRTKTLSLSVSLSEVSMEVEKKRLAFTTVSLPVSYSIYGYSIGGEAGFYLQMGTYISYVQNVTYNDRKYTAGYNSFFAEPFVSVGLHQAFRLMRWQEEVGGGRVFYGPFFSYSPMNMAKAPGVNLHFYSVGFRWAYLFM